MHGVVGEGRVLRTERSPGLRDDQVGAEHRQLGLQVALGALGQTDRTDHRRDADDRAEHDQQRAHLARDQARPRDAQQVTEPTHRRRHGPALVGDDLPVADRDLAAMRSRRRPRSCVTITTARSGDSSPAKISSTSAALAESSAPVGSSARIISGSVTMARASGHPLLLAARHLHGSVVGACTEPELLERGVRRARADPRGRMLRYRSAVSTLPSAVRCGMRWNCWNTKPIESPRVANEWRRRVIQRPARRCARFRESGGRDSRATRASSTSPSPRARRST